MTGKVEIFQVKFEREIRKIPGLLQRRNPLQKSSFTAKLLNISKLKREIREIFQSCSANFQTFHLHLFSCSCRVTLEDLQKWSDSFDRLMESASTSTRCHACYCACRPRPRTNVPFSLLLRVCVYKYI